MVTRSGPLGGEARRAVDAGRLVGLVEAQAIARAQDRIDVVEQDIRERAAFNRQFKAAQQRAEDDRQAAIARAAAEAQAKADAVRAAAEAQRAAEARKAAEARQRAEDARLQSQLKPVDPPLPPSHRPGEGLGCGLRRRHTGGRPLIVRSGPLVPAQTVRPRQDPRRDDPRSRACREAARPGLTPW